MTKLIAYYTNWSQYRIGAGAYTPTNLSGIAPRLSRINYSFLFFNCESTSTTPFAVTNDWAIHYSDWKDPVNIPAVVAYKTANPALEVFASIGGWNFNDNVPGTYGASTYQFFSQMVASPANSQAFIDSAVTFCQSNKLDGIDLDWEFPGVQARGGSNLDYSNYLDFLNTLASTLHANGLKLSIAVPATAPTGFLLGTYTIKTTTYTVDPTKGESYMQWLAALSAEVDEMQVMCYDYNGSWTPNLTGENAPLYSTAKPPTPCVESSIHALTSNGADPAKLIVGIPAYGHSWQGVIFSSPNPNQPNGPGCPAIAAGPPTYYVQTAGTIAYYETLTNPTFVTQTELNSETGTAYGFNSDTQIWSSFDNPTSAYLKGQWIVQQRLGGAMIYPLDEDTFMSEINPYVITNSVAYGLGL